MNDEIVQTILAILFAGSIFFILLFIIDFIIRFIHHFKIEYKKYKMINDRFGKIVQFPNGETKIYKVNEKI
jgi:TM2 domain-containing membrane protein YozV